MQQEIRAESGMVAAKAALVFLFGISTAIGQTPAALPPPVQVLEQLRLLAEEVRQLKLELAAHRLAYHEARVRDLDIQRRKIADEQRQLQEQDVASRNDLGEAEASLAQANLPPQERAALEEVRATFLTRKPEQMRSEELLLRQREYTIQGLMEQEQRQIAHLQERLRLLAQRPQSVQ